MKKINKKAVENYAELIFGLGLTLASLYSLVVYTTAYLRDGIIEIESAAEFGWAMSVPLCLILGIASAIDAIRCIVRGFGLSFFA